MVLSSGGNQPVRDAPGAGRPSPFTDALTRILLDERVPGTAGGLSADEVHAALERFTPSLLPRLQALELGSPRCWLGGSAEGTILLARRAIVELSRIGTGPDRADPTVQP